MKKYFNQDVFHSRPSYSLLKAFTNPGLLHYNGEEWRATKRFAMKSLKSLGFGRTDSEKLIHVEVDHFLAAINERRKKGPIEIAQLTGPAASNVVCLFVTGERFNYDDEMRKKLDKIFLRPLDGEDDRPSYLSLINFTSHFNFASVLVPGANRAKEIQQTSKQYITSRVEKVAASYNLIDEPDNFIKMSLKEKHDNQDNDEFNEQYFDREHIIRSCYSFFVAGSATTQEYLEWWFLLMANHPEVQEKVRKEVDTVIGSERAALIHRTKMPYTEAVIFEVHRYASLVSLNLPHVASEDAQFGAYLLPKGTQIILNIHAIHHDPDNFDHANQFKPERFLTDDGNKFIRSDKIIPFGHGRRSCPGESLAQAEIFIFTVSTLQKYILKTPVKFDGETYTSLFSNLPTRPAAIIFEPR